MVFWKHFLDLFGGRGSRPGVRESGPETIITPQVAEATALLQALADGGQVPGLAVRIQYRGTTLLRAAYGYADLENRVPASPGTLFRIASVSKPITATALARLVEAGKLRLEDPLEDYVPEFPQRGIHLEQLAAHTAGLRGYRGKEYALNKPLSIAESLEIFRDDPLVFRPGKGFLYNSFDFVLLSLAMERALGMPFHELVRRYVLEPLYMRDTCMELPGQLRRGQARPYTRGVRGFRPSIPVDNRYKLAGGGYLSTVDDICRLGQAYLDGTAVDPAIAREFLTSRETSGSPTWYGLGWQVSQDAGGREYYGHVGNAVGGYSNFFVYPEQELVVAILINCTDPGLQPLLDTAVDAAHEGIGRDSA